MQADEPFALLITWTCYGTWLPGDERGHVSNTLVPEGGFQPKQNVPGTACTADDAFTREHARQLQKGETVHLSTTLARVAAEELVKAARERGWRILRGAVMHNHIHVLVTDCPDDGPVVRRILKGCSQAALSRFVGQSQRWWTAGGSDRYKHGASAVEAADRYVANQPGMLVEIVNMEVRVVACAAENESERRGSSPPSGPPG
jgi:REP element-mobilizing transposase RayT